MEKLSRKLKKYKYSKQILAAVEPVAELISQNMIVMAEEEIARLALRICEEIEKGSLSPQEGDNHFTLIDLYIHDNYPKLQMRNEIQELLFEGMILHDYGEEYGADLSLMRKLAGKILGQN